MTAMPPIVVIAGGLATRMGEVTTRIPQSMIPVNGEPFIAIQLRKFRSQGITHVILCIGYLGEQIRDFVGDGASFGLKVDYSFDGPILLGTGGAVRQALPLLADIFLLIYGDSYLDIAYPPVVEAFQVAGKPGLMTVLHNEGRWDTSNVEFAKGQIVEYSKQPTPRMAYIDYGLSVLRRDCFDAVPHGAFDLGELFRQMVARGEMAGYEVTTRFYEIGSPAGLEQTAAYLAARVI